MGCPYLAIAARSSCKVSPVAYFQSTFELKAYCNTAHQELCPFFIHAASNTAFDPPDHHLWSLGSFRRSRPTGREQREHAGQKTQRGQADTGKAASLHS
jgi:hypothetical protein